MLPDVYQPARAVSTCTSMDGSLSVTRFNTFEVKGQGRSTCMVITFILLTKKASLPLIVVTAIACIAPAGDRTGIAPHTGTVELDRTALRRMLSQHCSMSLHRRCTAEWWMYARSSTVTLLMPKTPHLPSTGLTTGNSLPGKAYSMQIAPYSCSRDHVTPQYTRYAAGLPGKGTFPA